MLVPATLFGLIVATTVPVAAAAASLHPTLPEPPASAGAAVTCLAGAASTERATAPCCFVNEAYTGVCKVAPAEPETCDTILRYLNTPNTTGKTYCESTRIRGGWTQVPCPPAHKPAAAGR